ncbi:MAG: YqjD family protein [Beijerinckiaceae bacterium]
MSEESKGPSATSDLAAELAALREDIAKISASLVDLLHEKAASGVLNVVDGARQTLSDKAAEAQDKVNSISADVESTIERNPLVAVLIAALAGFVVGILSRSRK